MIPRYENDNLNITTNLDKQNPQEIYDKLK